MVDRSLLDMIVVRVLSNAVDTVKEQMQNIQGGSCSLEINSLPLMKKTLRHRRLWRVKYRVESLMKICRTMRLKLCALIHPEM